MHDSPHRAHSIAAQGGINAAKNYQNDGDSVYRLFYDTIKGGDYRSREANVYRLAQINANIIDQCAAERAFAREYGGTLSNHSFGGIKCPEHFTLEDKQTTAAFGRIQFNDRPSKRWENNIIPRREMLDVVVINGKAKGIIVRNLISGENGKIRCRCRFTRDGWIWQCLLSVHQCQGRSNVTATAEAHRKGAFFANPCYTQIHPTCIPVSGSYQSKLTLMSESLGNDGQVWVPLDPATAVHPRQIPEEQRDYYLERRYQVLEIWFEGRCIKSGLKSVCDEGEVGTTGRAVYLDFEDAIERDGENTIQKK